MRFLHISRKLLATIISAQWGLIFCVSFAQDFSTFNGSHGSHVAANSKRLMNPLVPSLKTFVLRPILQLAQFISYTIVGFYSVQKSKKELSQIFDKNFLMLVAVYSTLYTLGLLFLYFEKDIEATVLFLLMNLMSWKVLLELIFRCHEVRPLILLKSETLILILIQNCLSGFSAFSHVVCLSMLNGVMIHKFGMPEVSASLFTVGLIAHGVFTWGYFDAFQLSVYTTYIFMHGMTFLWAIEGIFENMEQEQLQDESIFLFVGLIKNFVHVIMLFKLLNVGLELVYK